MVKSKRNKVVHLTQVKKKTKGHKEQMIQDIKQYVAQYKNLFIMDIDNVGSDVMRTLRLSLKPEGRVFAGKNTVLRLALKQSRKKTSFDAVDLKGHYGYIFTNQDYDNLTKRVEHDLNKRLLAFASLEAKEIKLTKL